MQEKQMFDLYTCPTPNGYGVSITLEELGLPYEIHDVDMATLAHKEPAFLALNPNGRVPVLRDRENGLVIWESAAIRIYLAEKSGRLLPVDPTQRWAAFSWTMLQATAVGPNQSQANIFHRFWPEHIPSVISRFRNETRRLYGVINGQLRDHEYLANEYSIADCGLWPWIRIADYGEIRLEEYPHLARWFARVGERPAVMRGLVPDGNHVPEAERYEAAQKILMY
jgi:glutathione S-transferase